MKSKTEIRNWLLENAVDEYGDLDINGLDFSEFDGDVLIIGMEVKGNVIISGMKTQGNLYQSGHEEEGEYNCEKIKVKGGIYTNEPTKLQKEITTEELAELGYELKGE